MVGQWGNSAHEGITKADERVHIGSRAESVGGTLSDAAKIDKRVDWDYLTCPCTGVRLHQPPRTQAQTWWRTSKEKVPIPKGAEIWMHTSKKVPIPS